MESKERAGKGYFENGVDGCGRSRRKGVRNVYVGSVRVGVYGKGGLGVGMEGYLGSGGGVEEVFGERRMGMWRVGSVRKGNMGREKGVWTGVFGK